MKIRFLPQKRKKWRVLLCTLFVIFTIVSTEQIATSVNVSASDQIRGSAVFSPLPNMEAIEKEVHVIKDLAYGKTKNSLLDIYHPIHTTEPLPVILWIHGGGYVSGSKDSRQNYGMALANAGYVVANIDYALAPDQLYPGPVLQANAALEFLALHAKEYGGDMSRIFIGGDSAGSQIASQIAAVISNKTLAKAMDIQPAIQSQYLQGALLMCGLYNMETVRATGFPNIDLFLNTYTGSDQFESFSRIHELSTVNQITPDYPPVFITVGDGDPFSSQAQELVQALESENVAVDSVFFEGSGKGLKHEYQYALDTVDGQETLEKTLNFLFANSNR
ncbi:alpha/beta hydrolase [Planococcus shixiaomingii]|uniref:alpha/beta hydrolase n=1 Tax=Planococcus shixiaomingii TaxID=3058393 RepID=UPI002603516E|nr:alpha/beta hydrolase [Planococcus sp. N022]WKA55108.1 alpha/beta hydrolase [Planococcus sp. N022]